MAELEVAAADLDELYDDGVLDLAEARDLPCHQGLVLLSDRGTALGRVGPDKQVHLVRGDREAFGIHGRSAEQRIALEMLLDPEVGIVSLGGRAGTGKSAMALCAGLEAVMERRQHKKVVVFRPLFAVGGQELGYLPGSESEKMSPWGQAVFDTLGAMTSKEVIDEILDRGMLEVLPLGAGQRDVREQRVALELLDHRDHAVVPADPQVVALGHVVGEHDLGVGADPGQHGEQHVALQRLGLVDDHEGVVQRAAADVGQRQHLEHARGRGPRRSRRGVVSAPRVSKTAWPQGDIFSDSLPGR